MKRNSSMKRNTKMTRYQQILAFFMFSENVGEALAMSYLRSLIKNHMQNGNLNSLKNVPTKNDVPKVHTPNQEDFRAMIDHAASGDKSLWDKSLVDYSNIWGNHWGVKSNEPIPGGFTTMKSKKVFATLATVAVAADGKHKDDNLKFIASKMFNGSVFGRFACKAFLEQVSGAGLVQFARAAMEQNIFIELPFREDINLSSLSNTKLAFGEERLSFTDVLAPLHSPQHFADMAQVLKKDPGSDTVKNNVKLALRRVTDDDALWQQWSQQARMILLKVAFDRLKPTNFVNLILCDDLIDLVHTSHQFLDVTGLVPFAKSFKKKNEKVFKAFANNERFEKFLVRLEKPVDLKDMATLLQDEECTICYTNKVNYHVY